MKSPYFFYSYLTGSIYSVSSTYRRFETVSKKNRPTSSCIAVLAARFVFSNVTTLIHEPCLYFAQSSVSFGDSLFRLMLNLGKRDETALGDLLYVKVGPTLLRFECAFLISPIIPPFIVVPSKDSNVYCLGFGLDDSFVYISLYADINETYYHF